MRHQRRRSRTDSLVILVDEGAWCSFPTALLAVAQDILMAYDRSLIVADPRRCEPKKFGGSAV